MWSACTEPTAGGRGTLYRVEHDSRPATVADAVEGWRADAAFRDFFNALLAASPYAAFRWETPPVTSFSMANPFEFVLLDSPSLARRPDPKAFAEHFPNATDGVATFLNLGGDAMMVVPCPVGPAEAYGHLAAFVRLAPEPQRQVIWKAVAEAMAGRIGTRPVWLSTAGDGVAWLHIRLDDRPKYYGYLPYRSLPPGG